MLISRQDAEIFNSVMSFLDKCEHVTILKKITHTKH